MKFLLVLVEKQIKDVQESRDKFARETRVDATDAAGVRRKLPIHYHCISCNRPVELPVRDSEPTLPENDSLPYRRMKFPFVSYDVEQVSSLYDRHSQLTFFTPFSPNPIFGLFTWLDTIVLVCGREHIDKSNQAYE